MLKNMQLDEKKIKKVLKIFDLGKFLRKNLD